MAKRMLFLLVVFLACFWVGSAAAQSEDDTPWGDVLNPDGSIRWDQLTDLGVTTEEADWMDMTLPGNLNLDLDATYHRYVTSGGNVVVLPSPATLLQMALHPEESGLNQSHSMLGNGVAVLSLLLGPNLSQAELANLAEHGYTSTDEFFQAVIDGDVEIWSVINITHFANILEMSADSGFYVNALLMYVDGLANCAELPGGCEGLPVVAGCPAGDCPPTEPGVLPVAACPAPTITQQDPTLLIHKQAPEYPLVVGQDPEKRGADIEIEVTVPPVVFTWYEAVQDPPTCAYNADGQGGGCPAPGSQYHTVTDAHGNPTGWTVAMAGNRYWNAIDGEIHCIENIELVPEPIAQVTARATLTEASRAWILTDLASKYYEAYIHQDQFNLVPGLGQVSQSCDTGTGVCSAQAQVLRVPFADPGTFDLHLTVTTQGAVFQRAGLSMPLTQPRVLVEQDALQVNVTLVTLIPAGGQ